MAQFRLKALEEVLNRKPEDFVREDNLVSDYYGRLVFRSAKNEKIPFKRSIYCRYGCH
jgi:glutamine synthetase